VDKIQPLSLRAICFQKKSARSGADGSPHLRPRQRKNAVFKRLRQDWSRHDNCWKLASFWQIEQTKYTKSQDKNITGLRKHQQHVRKITKKNLSSRNIKE
jgi:hypothetical protein